MTFRLFFIMFAVFFHLGGQAFARDVQFHLQSPDGIVTEKSYADKYLLIAIGFTACPDICPATLYEISNTLKTLKNPDAVQPLFVTIDPLNDDIARLNAYTQYFDPRIIGLSGDMAQIRALTDRLGANFGYRLDGKNIAQPQAGTPYTVYHSALLYLISPQRELVDAFDYRIGAEGLVKALDEALGHPPATDAKTADTGAEIPVVSCPLPKGFSKTDKALTLASILPDAAPDSLALVNLWALWCKPCREELPLLDAFAAQQNMAVHVLNLGDDPQDIADLFKTLQISRLTQTRHEDGDLLERFGAVGLPFTALFVDGKLLATKAGILDETDSLTAFAQCNPQP